MVFEVDAKSQINRFVDDLLVLADLRYDAVQVDDGVDRVQGAKLPLHNLAVHSFRHLRNQGGRDVSVVNLLEGRHDFPGDHTPWRKGSGSCSP